ncbi:hypothetical protein N7475_008206 [Penicillium sp. IBT 31633x]|nr:hypothetical protein N7475_008206 [Penicillium sp. IBT 31633x]
MSRLIDNLSPEIIPLIAQYLDSNDFFNLRLCNSYLKGTTLSLFLKLYFHTRTHMLSRHSLINLLNISNHPIFGRSIRSVIITTDHLTPDGLSDDPVVLTSWTERSVSPPVFINRKKYREHYTEQNSFRQSGLDTTYLSDILGNAVNCQELMLSDRDKPWGALLIKRETGVYPTSSMEREYSKIYIQQVFHVIVAAATASGVSIDTFRLNVGLERAAMSPSVLRFPELHLIQLQWASTLTSLQLLLAPPYDEHPHSWAKPLAEFILLFPHLETLDLYFYRRLQPEAFHVLSQALISPNLRALRLGGLDCLSEDLLSLFSIFQGTFREIGLSDVGINTKTDGSWQKMVAMFTQQLQIEKLETTGCNVDGHPIYLQKANPSSTAQFRVLGPGL